MTVTIAWWDLTDADVPIDALEQDLKGSIDAWCRVEGLRVKLWIADRENGRWGAVMWWDCCPSAGQLPPNRAAELIGRPPMCRAQFEVIAVAEGGPPGNLGIRRSRPRGWE